MINLETTLATKPKYLIGLIQAAGVAAYVILFVALVTNFGSVIEHNASILAPMIFLMTFVTSALICGSLVLAYPIWLTVQGQIKDGLAIVAWSAIWLLTISLMFVLLAVIVMNL